MTSSYYTGIGSRKTPPDIIVIMREVAIALDKRGYTLRSGGADGADVAFESGSTVNQIFIPWNGYSGRNVIYPIPFEAKQMAAQLHPYWNQLTNGAQALMSRNVMQVLGPKLDSMSEFVICWTPDGCINHDTRTSKTGGTGLAISLADLNHIPVFNLQRPEHLERIKKLIE